jgi:hypothetical protein
LLLLLLLLLLIMLLLLLLLLLLLSPAHALNPPDLRRELTPADPPVVPC